MNENIKNFFIVVATTFLLTAILDIVIYYFYSQQSLLARVLLTTRMFIPAIAVLILQYLCGRCLSAKTIGLSFSGSFATYLIAIIVPIVVLGISLGISIIAGFNMLSISEAYGLVSAQTESPLPFSPESFLLLMFFISLLSGFTFNAVFSLGEEILWRGTIPVLLNFKHDFLKATVVVWLVWFLWHVPLIVYMNYNYSSDDPVWLTIIAFAVNTAGINLFLLSLRYYSGSIIPPAIAHGTFNAFGSFALLFATDLLWTVPAGFITGIMWLLAGLLSYIVLVKKVPVHIKQHES